MVREEPETSELQDKIRSRFRVEIDELEQWESLMRDAYEKPFWRKVIAKVKERQHTALMLIVNGELTQRQEDKIRGQIEEDNFFLLLDEGARQLQERNNGR